MKLLLDGGTHLICHIIYNYDAMGAAVVAGSDGTEPLLTRSVPLRQTRTQATK